MAAEIRSFAPMSISVLVELRAAQQSRQGERLACRSPGHEIERQEPIAFLGSGVLRPPRAFSRERGHLIAGERGLRPFAEIGGDVDFHQQPGAGEALYHDRREGRRDPLEPAQNDLGGIGEEGAVCHKQGGTRHVR